MVIVDRTRCAYCGACVSVCPVEALTLAETRLVVDESCVDCGDCVFACPVGALQSEGALAGRTEIPSQRFYDLVVVGAGPGGAMAAQTAAQAGLSVLLLEKRQEIGSPVRCAEGVGHDRLIPFIAPDPRWIAATVNTAEITAVKDGEKQTLRTAGGRGYILERRIFDRILAERAAEAGAQVQVKTAVTGVIRKEGRVRGVRIRRGDYLFPAGQGQEFEIEAQLVIAADGVEAQTGRWAGLDLQLPLQDSMICVQYLLAGIDIDPNCTSYTIDYQAAPGGYVWIFPKGNRQANVGLGVQADLWKHGGGYNPDGKQVVGKETVLEYLNQFIERDPRLAQGFPVTLVAGNVPVALPPRRIVTDGLLVIGDAARQVDPITGGGIINAMTAGQMAARVAAAAIASNDTSAGFLSRYETEWRQSTGRKLERNYRLRKKFPPEQRSQERFIRAFALAIGG